MEGIMKGRLFLAGGLVAIAQIPAQAQVTLDIGRITCEQFIMEELAWPSRDFLMWISGYFNGKRDNTIIEPQTIKKNVGKVQFYCYKHPETTVIDAVKDAVGSDK
jgi:hypothetical protein